MTPQATAEQARDEALQTPIGHDFLIELALPPRPGAVAIITDLAHERFLLQLKDGTHPDVLARGKHCLFGGGMERDETPEEAIRRELYEEIQAPKTLDQMFLSMSGYRELHLPFSREYQPWTCHAYTFEILEEIFDELQRAVFTPGCVTEGLPEVVTREQLATLLQHPTSFLGALELVFENFLKNEA